MEDNKEQQNNSKEDVMPNLIKEGIKEFSDIIKHFISAKYSHDKTGIYIHLAIVATILIGIIFLSFWGKLDSSIIGTLLGTLIGFSFGNFPKSSKGKDTN
ncbi:MAG: hypothetical protein ACYDCN_06685 [Bacteroidia bacterium]